MSDYYRPKTIKECYKIIDTLKHTNQSQSSWIGELKKEVRDSNEKIKILEASSKDNNQMQLRKDIQRLNMMGNVLIDKIIELEGRK